MNEPSCADFDADYFAYRLPFTGGTLFHPVSQRAHEAIDRLGPDHNADYLAKTEAAAQFIRAQLDDIGLKGFVIG